MKYPRHIWEQIRGIKIEELQRVLRKDGWVLDSQPSDSILLYYHPATRRRFALHYHPGKTFPEKTLRGILEDIGWQIEDLIALKLIR